jgi:nitrogen regulatory protein P-II 1
MKKIEATIRAFKLDDVTDMLIKQGVKDITVSEVRYLGRHGGRPEIYRGIEHIAMLPRVKLEVVLADDMMSDAISAISVAAETGANGESDIFVIPIDEATRI